MSVNNSLRPAETKNEPSTQKEKRPTKCMFPKMGCYQCAKDGCNYRLETYSFGYDEMLDRYYCSPKCIVKFFKPRV